MIRLNIDLNRDCKISEITKKQMAIRKCIFKRLKLLKLLETFKLAPLSISLHAKFIKIFDYYVNS